MQQTEEARIAEMLKKKDTEGICRVLENSEVKSKKMVIMEQVLGILRMEEKQREKYTILSSSLDMDKVTNHYIRTKLLLRRLDLELPDETGIYEYIQEYQVSDSMLVYLILKNMLHKEQTVKRLIAIIEKAEGRNSKRAGYYRRILSGIRERE